MNKSFEEAMKKLAELRDICKEHKINLFVTMSDEKSFDATMGGDINEISLDVILNIYRFSERKLGETVTATLGASEVTKIFTDNGIRLLEEKKRTNNE